MQSNDEIPFRTPDSDAPPTNLEVADWKCRARLNSEKPHIVQTWITMFQRAMNNRYRGRYDVSPMLLHSEGADLPVFDDEKYGSTVQIKVHRALDEARGKNLFEMLRWDDSKDTIATPKFRDLYAGGASVSEAFGRLAREEAGVLAKVVGDEIGDLVSRIRHEVVLGKGEGYASPDPIDLLADMARSGDWSGEAGFALAGEILGDDGPEFWKCGPEGMGGIEGMGQSPDSPREAVLEAWLKWVHGKVS